MAIKQKLGGKIIYGYLFGFLLPVVRSAFREIMW
jgi:hypothetical protein